MIDIHTHILPGLDDGAANDEEAVEMARAAAADGVTQIVATPHSINWNGNRLAAEGRVASLKLLLAAAGIPLRLETGIEVWLAPDVVDQFRSGRVFSIGQGSYMLVELPLQEIPPYTEQTIFALQLAGVQPVLAHPERYMALGRNLAPLYNLVGRGVVCQMTAGSLLGVFGSKVKEMAEIMLTHHLAHVIASDAHSLGYRAPVLSVAVKRAAELIGADAAQAMVTTVPESIVAGREIEMPDPEPYHPKRHWLSWGG